MNPTVSEKLKDYGVPKMARELGLTRQAIYQWRHVPLSHVLTVEKLIGIDRTVLRPDVYPREAAQAERASA